MSTAVLSSRQLLETFLQSSPDIVLILASDHTIVLAGGRAAAAAGAPDPSDLTGLRCHSVLCNSGEPCAGCPVSAVLEGGGPGTATVSQPGRTLEVTAAPVEADGGGAPFVAVHARDVTGRLRAEEGLAATQDMLSRVSDAIDDIVAVVDVGGRVRWLNSAVQRVTGYTPEEVLSGVTDEARIHPDDLPGAVRALRATIDHGARSSFDLRFLCRDGRWRWLAQRSYPIPGGRDDAAAVVTARDVTDRREAEAALAVSEERYRTLVQAAPVGLWMVDADRETVFIEPGSVLPKLGYTVEQVLSPPGGHRPWNTPEVESAMDEALDRVYRGETVRDLEVPLMAADGSTVWLSRTITPMFDSSGNVSGCVGVSLDITERKHGEAALAESEGRFQLLLDSLSVDCWMLGEGRKRTFFCMGSVADRLGYTEEEILSHPAEERPWETPEGKRLMEEVLDRAYRGEPTFGIEVPFLSRDGRTVWALQSVAPIFDDRGKAVGCAGFGIDITDRMEAKAALAESEARFRIAFEAADDLACIKDVQGRYLLVNPAMCAYLGISASDVVGRTPEELFPESVARVVRDTDAVVLSGETVQKEIKTIHNGRLHSIHVHSLPMRSPDGRIVGVYTTGRDITERVAAEEALRESEERFRAVFETAQDSIYIKDADCRYLKVNPAFERTAGMPAEEILGRTAVEVFGDPASGMPAEDERVLAGEVFDKEYELDYRGRHRFVHEIKMPLRDASGSVVGICGYAREITERKLAEAAMRESAGMLRAVFETAHDWVFAKDERRRYVKANPAFARAVGKAAHEIIGRTYEELVPSSENGESVRSLDERVLSGEVVKEEFTSPVEERLRRFHSVKVPMRDSSGRVVGICGIARDVTELKEAEKAARRSESQFRSLAQNVPDVIARFDRDLRYTFVSAKVEAITGIPPSEFIGRTCDELGIPSDVTDLLRDALSTVFDTGEENTVEVTYDTPSGPRELEGRLIPEPNPDGVVETVMTVARDVTDSRRADRRLRRLNACLLGLGPDSSENIRRLTCLCGELIGSDCAVYSRLEDHVLVARATWRAPAGYDPADKPEGRVCYDVIRSGSDEPLVVVDLASSSYADTDPNVERCGLRTYVGSAVRSGGERMGAICALWRQHYEPTQNDLWLIGVLASAIGVQEERRRSEAALRGSERRFRAVFETAEDCVFIKGRDGVYQQVNPAMERLFAVGASELVGADDDQLFGPETAAHIRDVDARVLAGEVVEEERTKVIGGRAYAFHEIKVPLCDDSGSVIGLCGIARDVTERVEARRALAASENLLSSILEQSPFSTWIADERGTNIWVNDACKQLFGIARDDEVVGKYNMYRDDVVREAGLVDNLDRVFKDGRSTRFEIDYDFSKVEHVLVPGATHRRLDVTIFPVVDDSGALINAVVQHRDVTAERELEESLRQTQKMEAVGTLAGGIAHDFNNLLGAMMGYTSLLAMHLPPEDDLHQYVEPIERAGSRAAELTSRLLSFARRSERAVGPVNFGECVREVLKLLEGSIGSEVEVVTELPDDLPTVKADGSQLHQVLMNICLNAVEAMEGGGTLRLSAHPAAVESASDVSWDAEPGDYVAAAITDTGCGMDEVVRSRAFEPFFTTKPPGGGTGLGLAMVYGIVKDHGGNAEIASRPGEGTTLTLWLPVYVGEPESTSIDDRGLRRGSETILVVDDEKMMRGLLGRMLEEMGYRVILAGGGREGARIYEAQGSEIDLVLLDMMMPDLSGEQTLGLIKANDPQALVIACTGHVEGGAGAARVAQDVVDVLRKPFTIETLSSALRSALDT